jgi:hypothetical protein
MTYIFLSEPNIFSHNNSYLCWVLLRDVSNWVLIFLKWFTTHIICQSHIEIFACIPLFQNRPLSIYQQLLHLHYCGLAILTCITSFWNIRPPLIYPYSWPCHLKRGFWKSDFLLKYQVVKRHSIGKKEKKKKKKSVSSNTKPRGCTWHEEEVCKCRWPVGPGAGRPVRFYVGLARGFVHMCLHEKGKVKAVEKVGGGWTTWLASHAARPVGHHLTSYWLNQVGNPSLDPYKYPFTGGNQNTHYILEIPFTNLTFLVS